MCLFCLKFSVSLSSWSSVRSSGVYSLFIWRCVCLCMHAIAFVLWREKSHGTQWVFIVEKSTQCNCMRVRWLCVRACVGVVKGIMTAAAYAHVSLYRRVCVSEWESVCDIKYCNNDSILDCVAVCCFFSLLFYRVEAHKVLIVLLRLHKRFEPTKCVRNRCSCLDFSRNSII